MKGRNQHTRSIGADVELFIVLDNRTVPAKAAIPEAQDKERRGTGAWSIDNAAIELNPPPFYDSPSTRSVQGLLNRIEAARQEALYYITRKFSEKAELVWLVEAEFVDMALEVPGFTELGCHPCMLTELYEEEVLAHEIADDVHDFSYLIEQPLCHDDLGMKRFGAGHMHSKGRQKDNIDLASSVFFDYFVGLPHVLMARGLSQDRHKTYGRSGRVRFNGTVEYCTPSNVWCTDLDKAMVLWLGKEVARTVAATRVIPPILYERGFRDACRNAINTNDRDKARMLLEELVPTSPPGEWAERTHSLIRAG